MTLSAADSCYTEAHAHKTSHGHLDTHSWQQHPVMGHGSPNLAHPLPSTSVAHKNADAHDQHDDAGTELVATSGGCKLTTYLLWGHGTAMDCQPSRHKAVVYMSAHAAGYVTRKAALHEQLHTMGCIHSST